MEQRAVYASDASDAIATATIMQKAQNIPGKLAQLLLMRDSAGTEYYLAIWQDGLARGVLDWL